MPNSVCRVRQSWPLAPPMRGDSRRRWAADFRVGRVGLATRLIRFCRQQDRGVEPHAVPVAEHAAVRRAAIGGWTCVDCAVASGCRPTGRRHDGQMSQDLPPRAADISRHLSDLRSGTYEGARTSSGSRCSAREVKPTRSANTTVTTLRSSCASRLAVPSAAPHSEQNFPPGWFRCPHPGQHSPTKPTAGQPLHPRPKPPADLTTTAAPFPGALGPDTECPDMDGPYLGRHQADIHTERQIRAQLSRALRAVENPRL